MKKALLIIMVLTLTNANIAQSIQPCIVMQYNQKEVKTPLSGVQIDVRGAGTAVSDSEGKVTLNFTTYKPGDHVTVRGISKSGYEVFNTNAIEQWNITRNQTPFIIVLVKSSYFSNLKQRLKETSVCSYRSKYKKAKAKLEKMKTDGLLKEKEYYEQLSRIEDNYEKQLKNIDAYIDAFARFDLSELSNEEKRIIEMVHNGLIDEAVNAYDSLKIIEKYVDAINKRSELSHFKNNITAEINMQQLIADSLLSIIERQQLTLKETLIKMKKEEFVHTDDYLLFVKKVLDTFEILYAKDPNKYREDYEFIKREWEQIHPNNNVITNK